MGQWYKASAQNVLSPLRSSSECCLFSTNEDLIMQCVDCVNSTPAGVAGAQAERALLSWLLLAGGGAG